MALGLAIGSARMMRSTWLVVCEPSGNARPNPPRDHYVVPAARVPWEVVQLLLEAARGGPSTVALLSVPLGELHRCPECMEKL